MKAMNDPFDKLFHDYLDLCDSYKDELPIHHFGYAMIKYVSGMLFDCAPSEMVARETIRMGVEDGFQSSKDLKKERE